MDKLPISAQKTVDSHWYRSENAVEKVADLKDHEIPSDANYGCSVCARTNKAPVGSQIPVLTVCEILSQRMQYNDKLVSIRARTRSTDEGVWLDGKNCSGLITSDEYVWPSMIAIQTSDDDFTSSSGQNYRG